MRVIGAGFVRDVRNVASSGIIAILLTVLRSLLVLEILGPTLAGAWKAAMLLYPLGEFARLGVLRGMALRVPVLRGREEHEEAGRTAEASAGFALLVGVLLMSGALCASFFVHDPSIRLALRMMALVALVAQPLQFFRDLAVIEHRFTLRAKETLIASGIDFVSALLLCWFFGLAGLGISTLLAVLVPLLYLRGRQGFHFRVRLDLPRLKDLSRRGLPFSMAQTGFETLRFLDVFIISLMLGATQVGYYGISMLILEFGFYLMKTGISQVVSPHLLREFGRSGSAAKVAVFYEMPARLFSYTLPPLLGVGVLFLPLALKLFLPQYVYGTEAGQVTLWGVFFIGVHAGMGSFLAAAERIPAMLRLMSVLAPVSAVLQFAVIRAGFGLSAVAWVGLFVFALGASGEIYIARRSCGHSLREIALFLATIYLPLVFSMLATDALSGLTLAPALPEAVGLCVKSAILLLVYTPVLIFYENRFALLRAVRQTA